MDGVTAPASGGGVGSFWEHLGAADTFLLVVLGLSMLGGLIRGFSREAGSLFLWGISAWIVVWLSPSLMSYIGNTVSPTLRDSPVVLWGGRGLIFIVALAILRIAGSQITMARAVLPGGIDSLLGGGYGLARGYILLMIVFIGLGWAMPDWVDSIKQKSVVAPYIFDGIAAIQGYLPASLTEHLVFPASNTH
ncbi:hypothetical protein GS501_02315 [Saccharibacter sp. 17.LH.SD]|uniref:CvpA family protein n=1 Tax=Saccharibacter sp. 17.LH.SD TaxID=2689393 RepID=UPI00136A4C20|nr:CvpA family protein [Saccharibacter sp. 17.LH.SD]MXV43886.1 hypothetical protein [Saccharibacter sp. 17.LH.SD]